MSNVFQNALANSALVAVLDSSKTADVFHYKTTATPTIATERIVLDPLGGATKHDNAVVRFELPRYGLLSKLVVKLDITAATVAHLYEAGNPPIVQAIEYYEIVSQNRVLSRMTRENIIGALAELAESEQLNVSLAAGSNLSRTDTKPFTVYLPWMGKISGLNSALNERWDTGFTERLEFRVKFRSTEAIKKTITASEVKYENCKLITFFDIMKETDLKALRQANYGAGPLVLLNTSTFTEGTKEFTKAAEVAEGTESFSIPIHCNGVTPKTTISVRKMSSGAKVNGISSIKGDTTDGLEIQKVTLSGSGRELLSFDGRELKHLGRSSYMSGQKFQNVITIDWSCGKRLPGYSGGVSWREIASPELKIEFKADATAANQPAVFKCIVTHMQYDLLSVLPSNGRVQQSIST